MRTSILAFWLVALTVSPALASIVIHDGTPGIVAHYQDQVLDSNGRVWYGGNLQWEHNYWYDPPVPVDEIKFWSYTWFVTINEEYWHRYYTEWVNLGPWPDLPASVGGEPDLRLSPVVSPNPSPGLCRVSFRVMSAGAVSVAILDISGRSIRQLLDGSHPAGNYSLEWDGLDDGGCELPAGVYLTRIETAEGVTSGRIVLAR